VSAFDEMFGNASNPRQPYTDYSKWLDTENLLELQRKNKEAEAVFRRTGITFNVYGDSEKDERLIPFDIIPRILSGTEWRRLQHGLEQRVKQLMHLSTTFTTSKNFLKQDGCL
jgi:Uncharacterized conserved protein